jgi:hypothetical protein
MRLSASLTARYSFVALRRAPLSLTASSRLMMTLGILKKLELPQKSKKWQNEKKMNKATTALTLGTNCTFPNGTFAHWSYLKTHYHSPLHFFVIHGRVIFLRFATERMWFFFFFVFFFPLVSKARYRVMVDEGEKKAEVGVNRTLQFG